MKITCVSNQDKIKIYVDNILHIRIPRDKNVKVHSWINTKNGIFVIEIYCRGSLQQYEYYKKEMWQDILALLDKEL